MQQYNDARANNDQTCGDILQPAIARWSNGGNNPCNIYTYFTEYTICSLPDYDNNIAYNSFVIHNILFCRDKNAFAATAARLHDSAIRRVFVYGKLATYVYIYIQKHTLCLLLMLAISRRRLRSIVKFNGRL